ncbi:MAG: insulinase family protein, partial [Gemmatimonadetes bacterium]
AQRPLAPREAAGRDYAELRFEAPEAERHTLSGGITVFFIEEHTLPLVNLFARFRGGPSNLGRSRLGAATAVSSLLRAGGTRSLPPDSLEARLDHYAIQTAIGGGGRSAFQNVNALSKHLEPALELWAEMVRYPRFDSTAVEVWRRRELEDARRRPDDPGRLAISTFNHLLYGDHPVGWVLSPDDLEPTDVTPAALREVHARIFCPDNLVLGVVGDVTWAELEPLLERVTDGWPACTEPLPAPPAPRFDVRPGVYLVPRPIPQSTVIVGHTSPVRLADEPAYFASRIANQLLGSSGFSSRLMRRVRTQAGLAYSVASVWTTPRDTDGVVAAVTQTRADRTVAATRLILDVLREARSEPPAASEVEHLVQRTANSFVFNFQDPAQIVSRQMFYLAQGLPADWLDIYLSGIEAVTADQVLEAFRRTLRPDEAVILIVGDPEHFDEPPSALG